MLCRCAMTPTTVLARLFSGGRALFIVSALAVVCPDSADAQGGAGPRVPYTVAFEGLPGKDVDTLVRAGSQLLRLKDSPPASVLGLRRRLRADERRVEEVLKSQGYYGARITATLQRPDEEAAEPGPAAVTVTVNPGQQYSYAVEPVELAPGLPAPPAGYDAAALALNGKPAAASAAIAAERAAVTALAEAGYPFARVLPRRAEVDHARLTIVLTVRIDPGAYRTFGTVNYTGLDTVEAVYPDRLVPWSPTAAFNRSALTAYRQTLIDTQLFTSVKVEPVETANGGQSGPLDVAVSVAEGSLRTIGASVSYARDEGFGGGVSWQHRNFLGQAETLDLALNASELNQDISAALSKPAFRRPDQVLTTGVSLLHEDGDAFEEYSATVRTGLERDLWTAWRGGLGVTLEAAELRDSFGKQRSYLIGVPVTLAQDRTDSLLDPKRGHRLALEVTPYAGQFSGTALFARTSVTGSYYWPVSDSDRPVVLAVRAKIGSVLGEASAEIPANKRFYAGGGGSVRGFAYQLIGPLDTDNDPRGGRSLVETALEARVPVTDTISVVPFIDAGLVSTNVVPDLSETIRYGAGLGGRYETPVGPLRVDIAIPVNRRRGVDNSFQFYISFGQAF